MYSSNTDYMISPLNIYNYTTNFERMSTFANRPLHLTACIFTQIYTTKPKYSSLSDRCEGGEESICQRWNLSSKSWGGPAVRKTKRSTEPEVAGPNYSGSCRLWSLGLWS
jgi:hypothetical protein